jgi:hypothetical protein
MIKPPIAAVLAAAMLSLLAACNMVPNPQADQAARHAYQALRTGADISQDPLLGDEMHRADAASLAHVRALIPAGEPTRVDNRGFNFNTDASGGRATLTHAYVYADRTIVARTNLRRLPGAPMWIVTGIDITTEGRGAGGSGPTATVTSGGPQEPTTAQRTAADQTVRWFYDQMRSGADYTHDPRVGPEMTSAEALATVHRVQSLLPPGDPESVEQRSARFGVDTRTNVPEARLNHAFHYANRTIVLDTVLVMPQGSSDFRLAGFNINEEHPGATGDRGSPDQAGSGSGAEQGGGNQSRGDQ